MPIPIAALVAAAAAALSLQHVESLADAMAGAAMRPGRTIAIPTELRPPEVRLLENAYPAEVGTRNAPLVEPAAGRARAL